MIERMGSSFNLLDSFEMFPSFFECFAREGYKNDELVIIGCENTLNEEQHLHFVLFRCYVLNIHLCIMPDGGFDFPCLTLLERIVTKGLSPIP